MAAPDVTVVIPAHQAAATVGAAVRSAVAQEGVEVEVIVVDDGSTDHTGDVARESGDGRVRVVRRESPSGPPAARNDGLRRASGEAVVFLDADDELTPGALAALHAALAPDAVAACGRFQAVDNRGDPLDIGTWAAEQLRPVVRRGRRYIPSPEGLSPEAILTRLVTPPPGGVLVRRGAALGVGGYDPGVRRSEDVDFLVRLATVGRIASTEAVVLRYRRASGQRSQATRARQLGRQWALLRLIATAPTRAAARARARGVIAHHLDRARTRWRFGARGVGDAVGAGRSLALAGAFYLITPAIVVSRPTVGATGDVDNL